MKWLAVAGFIGAAAGAALEIVISGIVIPGLLFVAIPVVIAALVRMRTDRVSYAVAAVIAAVFLYGNLAYPVTAARLQHVEDVGPFVDAALRTLGLAAAVIGSVALLIRPGVRPPVVTP